MGPPKEVSPKRVETQRTSRKDPWLFSAPAKLFGTECINSTGIEYLEPALSDYATPESFTIYFPIVKAGELVSIGAMNTEVVPF